MKFAQFFCLMFCGILCRAQVDTAILHWKLNAGLLVGRTFANYPLHEVADENSSTSYRAVDSVSRFRPGFWLGADALLLKRETLRLVFGISVCHTSAAYRSVYQSVGPTTRGGYSQLERRTENNLSIRFTSINAEAGIRIGLHEYFFVTPSLLLNKPLRIVQGSSGFTRSVYTNNSGGGDSSVVYFTSSPVRQKEKPANLSFRLALAYRFGIGESKAEVTLFRNSGLIYALPWWGLGVSLLI